MNRVATYIISIIAVTLFIFNQALILKLREERIKCSEMTNRFFDMQKEYEALFDEVLRLEDENQILGSYAASQAIKNEE
tara:strand:+ start:4210 stop:4446 length:237 start_codon:yes stop_codon:yes gene_type:complete